MNKVSPDTVRQLQPLVSVGIPTYNRPDGLRRTLECITSQTYANLEIIVSDNASPGEETESIVREFMAGDTRIIYYRQPENLGSMLNFRFVLEKATGEYFMWAADDDEWENTFVSFCVDNIGVSGSIMTAYKIKFRKSGKIDNHTLPQLSGDKGSADDTIKFLKNLTPLMFYGMHKRSNILFFLNEKPFDWFDCAFCLRLIHDHGFKTLNNASLFYYGIDTEKYAAKPLNGKFCNPFYYYFKTFRYIAYSRRTAVRGILLHTKLLIAFLYYHTIREVFFRREAV